VTVQAGSKSLLEFLGAPVIVGDPDGRAVYMNPAFESDFCVTRDAAEGEPLAGLFEGGGREAVLRAVARVCAGGSAVHFRLRQGEIGYGAVASPIVAEPGRVGVVILLTAELAGEDKLAAFQRDVQRPLDELIRCLTSLSEQTGGRRDVRFGAAIEDAVRSLERIRKASEALGSRPGNA
jgi:PAS domain-containing protein